MNQVLCRPEILGEINEHLHGDFRTLVAVIRVNHAWFACAIHLLWRAPLCHALAKLTKDRRQLYATYIYHLAFEDSDHIFLPQLEGLVFPHLRHLSIDTRSCSPKECLRFLPYLVPSLLELTLCGANVEPSMLGLLPERCPRLTNLTLAALGPRISSQDLLTLLQGSPRIQQLRFLCRVHNVVSDEILTLLALRHNLKTLELNTWMVPSRLRGISGMSSAPFPAVEGLAMKIISPAVPQFVESFKYAPLRRLTLEVNYSGDTWSPGHTTLMALSHFVNLEALHLCFSGYLVVLNDELKVFHHLQNLRSLRLEPDCGYPEENDFTDDDVDQLLSHLPLLEDFKLYFRSDKVTAHLLHIISARCPRITWCEIPVEFIPGPQQNRALFPWLETLIIDGIRPRLEAAEEEDAIHLEAALIVKLTQYHCPRLRRFDVLDFNDFSLLVVEKWQAELTIV